MNAVLAFVIYYVYLAMGNYQTNLPLLSDHKFFLVNQVNVATSDKETVVTFVSPGSPADRAGIKPPAKIVSVNNISVKKTDEVIKVVNANKGRTLPISWQDVSVKDGEVAYGQVHTSVITPRKNPPENEGPTGIAFVPVALLNYETPTQKLLSGISHPLNLMAYNYDIITKLIARSIEKRDPGPVGQAVSGPVGVFTIGGIIGQIPDAKERIMQFLNLAGILSISLAFFNVLPIPALDGGRLFFILIEAIFRRKVRANIENYAHSVGMAILIALILLVTLKDILQLF
jgi:regulator of sigma E protease